MVPISRSGDLEDTILNAAARDFQSIYRFRPVSAGTCGEMACILPKKPINSRTPSLSPRQGQKTDCAVTRPDRGTACLVFEGWARAGKPALWFFPWRL